MNQSSVSILPSRSLMLLAIVAAPVVAAVLRITNRIACKSANASANRGAFQRASALVANDAAYGRTAQTADDGSSPGVWTIGAGCH